MLTPYSNNMTNNSYSNDRGGGIEEFAADPASGGFFHTDFKKLFQISVYFSSLISILF